MAKKKNKTRSLARYFRLSNIFVLTSIIGLVVLATAAFILILGKAPTYLQWISVILFILWLALFAFGVYRHTKVTNEMFYGTLLSGTKSNLSAISTYKKDLPKFETSSGYCEFEELNTIIDTLNAHNMQSISLDKDMDQANIPLEYLVPGDSTIVSYSSLVGNIREIILASVCFRDALVSFKYDMGVDKMNEEQVAEFIAQIKLNLHYSNMLIAANNDSDGFLLFIPNFDSISRLKEEINFVLKNAPIVKHTLHGLNVITCKAAVVVYPYSSLDDILSDLRYAERQGENVNFYFPNRVEEGREDVFHSTMDLNVVSKAFERFMAIAHDNEQPDDALAKIHAVLHTLVTFYGFDNAGYILRDDLTGEYSSRYVDGVSENIVFPLGSVVREDLATVLDRSIDKDRSYFFSNRDHVNDELGRVLDIYGIRSGLFYLIPGVDVPRGVIYFVNQKTNLFLTSYLREALVISGSFLSSAFNTIDDKRRALSAERRLEDYLKLSGDMLYTIDCTTHKLLYVSPTLRDVKEDAVAGAICHKALFGRDEPCDKCPILSKRKMASKISDTNYETVLTLNDKEEKVVQLMMLPLHENEIPRDRFDKELLCNSHYSFLERLNSIFLEAGRGHVLLLSIDNRKQLLAQYGPEGYTSYLRAFIVAIESKQGAVNNIYAYDPDTLAIILPETGRVDMVSLCERIYDISKSNIKNDGTPTRLDITYSAVKYPQDAATPNDFVRHLENFTKAKAKKKLTDMIYFEENSYSRSASRKLFFLSVIEKSFSSRSFSVKLQPMVRCEDSRIIGAELLLRLSDDYRGLVLNTSDLINVAAEHGKIGLISDTLVGYMGEIYQKYGATIFRNFGFERLSLNTDYSYFSDKDFITKMASIMKKYHFPRNFITFEVNESEINQHYDDFKAIAAKVISNNITLVCDQYTGEFISLDRLRAMGFTEIKIARSRVMNIDRDQIRAQEVMSLLESSKTYNMKACLVGVERQEAVDMVKELYPDVWMQGFHFYQPLGENDLINSIRKNK